MKLFDRRREPTHPAAIRASQTNRSIALVIPTAGRQLAKRIWQWRGVLVASPVMAGLVIALRFTGGLQLFEWALLDQFFRLRPPDAPDSRIVIVGVNETDIQTLPQYPITDTVMATLLQKVSQQQPRAIGLDIVRDKPTPPGHGQLVRQFQTIPNLMGAELLDDGKPGNRINPPPVLKQRRQVGFVNVPVDADDRLRRGLLYLEDDTGEIHYSLGLRLALIYLQPLGITLQDAASNPEFVQLGRAVLPRFRANDGGYVGTEDSGYQILLNLRGPAGSFTTVSLHEVLENRLPADFFRDKVVLIGATAVSLRDFFSTPYSGSPLNFSNLNPIATPEQTPGVEIQANLTSHLLSAALDGRSGIYVWAESWEWIWILGWSFLGASLSWSLRSRRWTIIAILLAGVCLVGSCFLLFLQGWWIPLVPPLLAMVSAAAVLTAYLVKVEQSDRNLVMNLFERHVTREIAETIWRDRDHILKKGRLPGQRMTATVLFSDLKNFTPIAENTNPEVLMSWLNEYLDAMAQIIIAHGGVVDKFIGDSVMAVFGVPVPRTTPDEIREDARRAILSALEMASRLEQLNQKWQQEGLPMVSMRIGISTGPVVTGSLGGLQKLDYTTIGDSVNVAARLESYDKTYEKTLPTGVCRILINETTYEMIQAEFPIQLIGEEKLRGRATVTKIYQVLLK